MLINSTSVIKLGNRVRQRRAGGAEDERGVSSRVCGHVPYRSAQSSLESKKVYVEFLPKILRSGCTSLGTKRELGIIHRTLRFDVNSYN